MIFVAGFFRTGTTVMTKCLGAPVLGRLMEYPPFRDVNTYILQKNGCLSIGKNKAYYKKPKKLVPSKQRMLNFFEQALRDKPIAIKDPQIQLTIEVWKELALFANGKFLVPIRNREDCIRSLMKRKDLIRTVAEEILDEYTDNFMSHSSSLRCCFYKMEDFFQKQPETIERIEDFIGKKLKLEYLNLKHWHFRGGEND